MSHKVSYRSIMLAWPKMTPIAMLVASTMRAWTHTHTYTHPPACCGQSRQWIQSDGYCLNSFVVIKIVLQHTPFTDFLRVIHGFRVCQDFFRPSYHKRIAPLPSRWSSSLFPWWWAVWFARWSQAWLAGDRGTRKLRSEYAHDTGAP